MSRLTTGALGTVTTSGAGGGLTDAELRASPIAVTQSGTWDEVGINDSGNSITVDAPVGTPVFVRLSDGGSAILTLPVSLASVPSHAVTNAGTFAVQVDNTVTVASHAVTNAGTFVVQENGAALTSLQLIDDTIFTDDTSTHSTGSTKGVGFMAAATPTDGSVNANDIGMVAMTTDRKLHVSVQDSLPAGTAAIGKLAANSGVDIGDVDVTSIATGTNAIGRVGHDITGIGNGVTTVTTAGTDVVLASSTACKRAVIQSQTDNTGLIAVGATGVDATEATGNGIILYPGDSLEIDIDNLADIFIDSTVNGEGVRYTYFT